MKLKVMIKIDDKNESDDRKIFNKFNSCNFGFIFE